MRYAENIIMSSRIPQIVLCLVITLLIGTSPMANADTKAWVYVSAGGSNEILLYSLNQTDGSLTAVKSFPIEGGPGALTLHPDGKHLYAALRNSKSVAMYELAPTTGELTLKGTTPVVNNPVYLHIDRSGKFLLMASFNGNQAATYRLNDDLTVTNAPSTVIATDKNPHSLLTDASDRFVYIPNMGGNLVQQYAFDKETGALNPLRLPAVTAALGDGPRHLAFHPIKPWLFVVNETGGTVTSYRHDVFHGGIMAIERYSTLPADFKGRNTAADIHVRHDGKFLYTSNRGHDSIATFAIEQDTGKLKPLGHTPTEKTPRAFELDPTGSFLIAAGQSSNQLATYRIDRQTGLLTPLKVYPTGKSPAWVLIRQGE